MKKREPDQVKNRWSRRVLVAAVMLIGLYAIAEMAGMRQYTSTISGTMSTGDWTSSIILCIIYIGLYFGAVLPAPILLLAALIEAGLACRRRRTG